MIVEAIKLEGEGIGTKSLVNIVPHTIRGEEQIKNYFCGIEETTPLLDGNFYLVCRNKRVFLKLYGHRYYFNIVCDDAFKNLCFIDGLRLEVLELEKVIKYLEGEYEDLTKGKCPKCDSFLTPEQSMKRMRLDANAVSTRKRKKEIEDEISKMESSNLPIYRSPMVCLIRAKDEEIVRLQAEIAKRYRQDAEFMAFLSDDDTKKEADSYIYGSSVLDDVLEKFKEIRGRRDE